jgi:transcriptional regulator with XRE-family HTH domain
MTPHQFKTWRKAMGLKQKDAADRLGLKKRVIQYYERGHRDGKKVEVPKSVELACYAVTVGVDTFDGAVTKKPARKSATPVKR